MAYLHRQKRDGTWFLIDKSYQKAKWIKLGQITQTQAKRVLLKYETDKTYLRLGIAEDSLITFPELCDEYIQHQKEIKILQETTIQLEEWYIRRFKKAFGKIKAGKLTADMVQKKFSCYKPNTIRLYVQTLRKIYRYAIERQYVRNNPILGVKIPRIEKLPPKNVDPKIIKKILRIMEPGTRLPYEILYYTGMRPSECLRLIVKDVNLQGGLIMVRKTKTGTFRSIPIHPKLSKILLCSLKNKHSEEPLFPGKVDIHQKSLKMALRRACEKLKVKVTPYQFRHTFATQVLDKIGNIRVVQELLGHSNIQQTTRYATALAYRLKEGVESLD